MSVSHAASLVIMGAFEGSAPTPEENLFFSNTPLGGFIFFKRNISDNFEHTLPQFLSSLQEKYGQTEAYGPLLLGIDQEGGRVSRLGAPCPNLGPALNIFKTEEKISSTVEGPLRAYGRGLGNFLKNLGFNINFAPVVDILTNNDNTCIGDRAFGQTPEEVTQRAEAFLQGMQSSGILGCLKHFPGQGEASVDTHLGTALIKVTRQELHTRELIPYKRLLKEAKSVMIAHCIYSDLDTVEATRSRVIVEDLLKVELGYQGLIISDDMVMGAVSHNDDKAWCEALCQGIVAGIDLLIISKKLPMMQRAIEYLNKESQKSHAFAVRLDEAARKVIAVRQGLKR